MILERLTFRMFTKTTLKERMAFQFRHLSLLLSSGMDIGKALEFLITHCRIKKVRQILTTMHTAIVSDSSSELTSIEKTQFYNPAMLYLLGAKKTDPKVPDFLNSLAKELEYSIAFQRKLLSALIYPFLLLVISAIITSIILLFVVPVFKEMFQDFGAMLPVPTQSVIAISNFIIDHQTAVIIALILLPLLMIKFRSFFMIVLSFLPFLGSTMKKVSILQFIRYFALLIITDVPLRQSVIYASTAVDNPYFSKQLKKMAPENDAPDGLAGAVAASGLFTEIDIQAVKVAEQTQSMNKTFEYLNTYYEEQVTSELNTLTSALDVFFICLIGIIVGGIVIAMYLPIFTMAGAIS